MSRGAWAGCHVTRVSFFSLWMREAERLVMPVQTRRIRTASVPRRWSERSYGGGMAASCDPPLSASRGDARQLGSSSCRSRTIASGQRSDGGSRTQYAASSRHGRGDRDVLGIRSHWCSIAVLGAALEGRCAVPGAIPRRLRPSVGVELNDLYGTSTRLPESRSVSNDCVDRRCELVDGGRHRRGGGRRPSFMALLVLAH